MSVLTQPTWLQTPHPSPTGQPFDAPPAWWSVVLRHRHARLVHPRDDRSVIVDYLVDGRCIQVDLPIHEVVEGDLEQRLVTLEILDDYLSMTAQQVSVVGRVAVRDGLLTRAHRSPSRAVTRHHPQQTVVVLPLALQGDHV